MDLTPAIQSKAEALLGGAPSALSRITGFQEGNLAAANPGAASAATCLTTAPVLSIAPAVDALPPRRTDNDFLSSSRLSVSHTPFDRQWGRVSSARLSKKTVMRLDIGEAQPILVAELAAVNAWANLNIRYTEDQALYGRPDYWANAGQTLSRRAGDCEDIAILRYQLLLAAGVPRETMFLTVARDLVRHADHAVLMVRDGDNFWLLDNATNVLVDGRSAQDYRPIFSYSQDGKWIHGYRGELAGMPGPVPAPALNAQ